ncbi:alpha/beta hydrolase-fold protein [Microbacterium karelineae]|uniref:carboxylesterase family protein n=1 Tax=Microbacterium karelineae TaxID=2654283 RepID=UPI0012E99D51|nr:alpha/beta hydrolase-fold protein [Microbacterium karelineae]
MTTITTRAAIAAATSLILVGSIAACSTTGETDDVASTDETTSQSTTTDSSTTDDSTTETVSSEATSSPDLEDLVADVQPLFDQAEYVDEETGETLPYNIYLPEDYDESQEYPVVLYIPDSSLVGDDVTAPLGEYGALIWASEEQQATQESIVVVPAYPEVILDDHDSYTTTEYVDMTERFLESIIDEYSVDEDRVYGTGQSMGCMTILYLAAQNPDLFTAELFVSGQWDITQLEGLSEEDFFYIAAAGDENASGGQADVEAMLDDAGVAYGTATWDATDSEDAQNAAALELLSNGYSANFATFEAGTVLEANPDAMAMEHMASFEPAYRIGALRDWLLAQTDAD